MSVRQGPALECLSYAEVKNEFPFEVPGREIDSIIQPEKDGGYVEPEPKSGRGSDIQGIKIVDIFIDIPHIKERDSLQPVKHGEPQFLVHNEKSFPTDGSVQIGVIGAHHLPLKAPDGIGPPSKVTPAGDQNLIESIRKTDSVI